MNNHVQVTEEDIQPYGAAEVDFCFSLLLKYSLFLLKMFTIELGFVLRLFD